MAMIGLSAIGVQLAPAGVSLPGDGASLAGTGVNLGGGGGVNLRPGGPLILLSSSTVPDNATIGTTIGVLSVINGSGSYTFTLTSNPGTLFAISGSNLNVAAALTAGSYPIQINADNGAGSVVTQPFLITVTPTGAASLDFSKPANSQYLGVI